MPLKLRSRRSPIHLLGFGILAVFLATPEITLAETTFTTVALSRTKFPVNGKRINLGSFGAPAINSQGAVAFYGTIYGSSVDATTNSIIGRIRKKKARVIVRENTPIQIGQFSLNYEKLSTNPQINDQSRVAWTGDSFNGATVSTDVNFTSKNGSPGSYGGFVDTVVDPLIDLNNGGAISLTANDAGTTGSPLTVYRITPGRVIPLVAVGETAIGLPLGSTFTSFGTPTVADNNFVFFAANVSNTDALFDGIWYGKNGDPQPLVQKGQSTSSSTRSETFTTFADPAVPAPSGKALAFAASTSAGTNVGIWLVEVATGAITEMAKAGARVPDYPVSLSGLQPPATNNAGQVAFLANPGTDKTNLGLFFAGAPGDITKILAVGDDFDLNGQTVKVIDIRFSSTGGINRSGQVVFTASFDNRTSGIFIAKP